MELEERLVLRNAENELRESECHEMEERELRYWAKFREAFRKWPDVIARLDDPVAIEDRIRQRRAGGRRIGRSWTMHRPGCAAA
jgi:hypothetical protein